MDPRTLLVDIETFPYLVWTWGLYEQNAIATKRSSIVCAFSAKWLGGKQITKILPDYGSSTSDKKLITEIWKLMNEAEVIVAHNGDRFDIKKLNTRFVYHGLTPPAPYKTVDTLKEARRHFSFGSNKLNDLCAYLGLGEKVRTGGFELWQGCMAGDQDAWSRMKTYNARDVVLLEKLYLRLLPWMNRHPMTGPVGCPKCGSSHLQSRGQAKTRTSIYKRFQCQDCGGWARSRKSSSTVPLTHA